MTVDGAGSTWTNSFRLTVGGSDDGGPGAGTLIVRDGGRVDCPHYQIGYEGIGVVVVDGPGSVVTSAEDGFGMVFGDHTVGRLEITNGGGADCWAGFFPNSRRSSAAASHRPIIGMPSTIP